MLSKTHRRISGWPTVFAVVLAITAFRWAVVHLVIVIFLTIGILGALAAIHFRIRPLLRVRRAGKRVFADPHRMNPAEFEHYLADLCLRDGCNRVQVVGGANDHGADVLYIDPHGRRGMIQAKRYAPGNSVGNEHVQIVNGTYRDAHGCAHAAIVTTSHFTKAASAYADRVGIALLDDHRLTDWARGNLAAAPWN